MCCSEPLCTALVVVPFYGPYLLTSQVGATQTYLGERIGEGLLKNRIGSFLAYGTFYSSFLYIALTGGLVLVFMAWRVHAPERSSGSQELGSGRQR